MAAGAAGGCGWRVGCVGGSAGSGRGLSIHIKSLSNPYHSLSLRVLFYTRTTVKCPRATCAVGACVRVCDRCFVQCSSRVVGPRVYVRLNGWERAVRAWCRSDDRPSRCAPARSCQTCMNAISAGRQPVCVRI